MIEAAELTEVSMVTVVEKLWPLPMAADRVDGGGGVSVVSVVETLWQMPMLLPVLVAPDMVTSSVRLPRLLDTSTLECSRHPAPSTDNGRTVLVAHCTDAADRCRPAC